MKKRELFNANQMLAEQNSRRGELRKLFLKPLPRYHLGLKGISIVSLRHVYPEDFIRNVAETSLTCQVNKRWF